MLEDGLTRDADRDWNHGQSTCGRGIWGVNFGHTHEEVLISVVEEV